MKPQLEQVQKAHLDLKKTSVKMLCGAATILMLAQTTGAAVYAVTGTPEDQSNAAQNLPDTQKPDSNTDALQDSGKKSGKLALNIDHSALDKAVSDAKALGLTVTKESTQDKGTAFGTAAINSLQKTVTDDYSSQTTNLTTATSKYKTALDAYNKALDAYNAKLAEIQDEIDKGTAGAPALAAGQGLNFRKGKNPNATVDSVKFSGSGDGALLKANTLGEGLTGLGSITSSDTTTSPAFYDIGGTTSLFGLFLDAGQSVTIHYKDLKNLDVNGTTIVEMSTTYKNPTNARMGMLVSRDPGNQFQFGVDTGSKIFVNQPKMLQETMQFFDDSGKSIAFQTIEGAKAQFMAGSLNYSKSSVQDGSFPPNSDGYNQHESVSFDNNLVGARSYPQAGVGKVSGKPTSGANASSDSYGSNPPNTNETWAAKGFNDYTYNGSMYDSTTWDIGYKYAWYGAVNLTPKDGQTSISVTWSTTDGNMWANLNGQLPTLTDGSDVPTPPTPPTKPTLKYHLDSANAQTANKKTVTTVDGLDLNGQKVNKQQIEQWHFQNDALPAYHEKVTEYSMSDELPNGFVVDLEKTKALNKAYTIDFDEKTNKIIFTATAETLKAMNADLTKAYTVPEAVVQGQVVNDSAFYPNDFTTTINGYTINSNVVDVYTPGPQTPPEVTPPGVTPPTGTEVIQPEKVNENAAGEDIADKGISNQATNFYKMTWKLTPYKDIASSSDDVNRGFFYVDDAPELVNVDLKNTTFTDSTGNAVPGIKATLYASVEEAPQEVQDRLKASEITPEGQFVYYEATDPQSFYTNYVQKGLDITIKTPMSFKEGATGDYENKVYQSDFGNGYEGNTVKNHIIAPKATKQVSVDGGKTWHDSDKLSDNDSNYDYKLNFSFTANGDYTSLQLKEEWQSVQWVDLSKITVTAKDGKAIPGTFKVFDQSGKDVTEAYNKKTFQTDGKKEALWIIFTPNDLSDVTSSAASDDQDGAVELTMLLKDVTLKGASGKELSNYLDKDGKIEVTNVAQMQTTSKTASGDSTKEQVTKTNVTKVTPPALAPMINKYIYETGVGSSVDLYGKDVKLPEYLSKLGQFTSLNLNKDKKVKVGDTVKWMVVAQSGNTSLMKNITDTLPKELSFAENPNFKVFVLSNDGKSLEEVTKDWKIEQKDQTLTATPNDPTKYFFAGSSTNSRVVVTLDTVLNEDVKSGTYNNVATLTNKDGKSKSDKASVHTTVKAAAKDETLSNPVEKVVEKVTGSLPKTGEGRAALGISLFGAALLGIAAVLKRRSIVAAYRKAIRKIRK